MEFQARVDHHYNAHPIGLGIEEFTAMAFDVSEGMTNIFIVSVKHLPADMMPKFPLNLAKCS